MKLTHRVKKHQAKRNLTWLDRVNDRFLDIGRAKDLVIVAGMGRSGTTWASNIMNYDNRYRVLFEPFFPARVKEAQTFDYLPYLSPHCHNPLLAQQAKLIMAGKIRNEWVDRDNTSSFYRHRIIKDIRCNLMLGWLKQIAHNPPIVLLIRHPLQVVASWAKLGWGLQPLGNVREVDILMSKQGLLQDFPIIEDVWRQIDQNDFVESTVFQWCVYHLVPSYHLRKHEAYTLFYENLLLDLNDATAKLFHYLNRRLHPQKLKEVIANPSSTNFLKRDFYQDKKQLLNSWQDQFSINQIQKTAWMLSAFELDHLYDRDGYPRGATLWEKA